MLPGGAGKCVKLLDQRRLTDCGPARQGRARRTRAHPADRRETLPSAPCAAARMSFPQSPQPSRLLDAHWRRPGHAGRRLRCAGHHAGWRLEIGECRAARSGTLRRGSCMRGVGRDPDGPVDSSAFQAFRMFCPVVPFRAHTFRVSMTRRPCCPIAGQSMMS